MRFLQHLDGYGKNFHFAPNGIIGSFSGSITERLQKEERQTKKTMAHNFIMSIDNRLTPGKVLRRREKVELSDKKSLGASNHPHKDLTTEKLD